MVSKTCHLQTFNTFVGEVFIMNHVMEPPEMADMYFMYGLANTCIPLSVNHFE